MSKHTNWIAVFPGQGAQHVGMGKDLYENFAIARETFEEASDAIRLNLKKLCFDGPESELTLTENTQPSLLTTSVAAFRVAQAETGFKPSVVAGHSLGEYSALVAAGAITLADAVRWVKERGAAMQKAVPAGEGTMAAVMGLQDEQVRKVCELATDAARKKRDSGAASELTVEAVVQPANFNSPGQIVIAGSRDAVEEAVAMIKAGSEVPGGKAIPLQVSAPFHCSLMKPARDRMAALFKDVPADRRPQHLDCPYVPNRTARITSEPGVIFDLLEEQVDSPVLWTQTVLSLIKAGYTQGAEFGPGKVLQGLAKRISQKAPGQLSLVGVSDSTSLKTF